MRIDFTHATHTYPRIDICVALSESYCNQMEPVYDYLEATKGLPVRYVVAVQPDDEKFNQATGWNTAAQYGRDPLVFSCAGVYPTQQCVADTFAALAYDPNCFVVGTRIDQQEDGTYRFNALSGGDWLAMSRTTFGTDGLFDVELGWGGYVEFDLITRLLVAGHRGYVTEGGVIHKWHKQLCTTPEAEAVHHDHIEYSKSKGLPHVWWRWPAQVWLEWKDHTEIADVRKWEGVPCR